MTSFRINGETTAGLSADEVDEPATDRICGDCEVAGAANYCKNCEMSFCDECKQKHLAQKVLRNHVVVLHSEHKTCSTHEGEEIKVSCACGELLCGMCAIASHEGHKKTTVQEAASKHRQDVTELSAGVIRWLEAVLEEAVKSMANHTIHVLGLHELIDAIAAKLMEYIKRQVIRMNLLLCFLINLS